MPALVSLSGEALIVLCKSEQYYTFGRIIVPRRSSSTVHAFYEVDKERRIPMLLKLRSNLKVPGFASHTAWLSKTGVLRALALLVLACTGCSGVIQSRVLDAETGKPLAGAIAVAHWRGPCNWRCRALAQQRYGFFAGAVRGWVEY